jgi:hypothetical protein
MVGVSGQLHAPATLPPGEAPPAPTGEQAGWAPELVWTLWGREKNLLPLLGIAPLAIQPTACAIPTELLLLGNF